MSVTITKYPKRVRDGHTSKWVALHNPIIYEVQRKDYVVASVTRYIPTKQLIITLASPIVSPDEVVAGDYVYVKSGLYDVVLLVASVQSSTSFRCIGAWYGVSTGGFMNLNTNRENYNMQVDILGVDITNTYFVIGSATVTPDPTGLMKVDVHEWVKELAGYANEYGYAATPINVKDLNLSNTFNIRFIERWNNDDEESIQEAAINESERHFFVNGAKQIADAHGQNMAVYVPLPSLVADVAEFLTGFESPTAFRGYPFDLPFIYSDNITPYLVYRVSQQFDLNDGSLGVAVEDVLDYAGAQFVNRMKLPAINASAKSITVYLKIYTGDTTKMYGSGYAVDYADDYYEILSAPAIPSPPIEIEE